MLEMDSLIPSHSVTMYVDYPEELVVLDREGVSLEDVRGVVIQVVKGVTALIVENYLASIPVFDDMLYQLIENIVTKTIEDEDIPISVEQTTDILALFVSGLNNIIGPIVQGYVPPLPLMFSTTLVDVMYRSDCVILTIHY